VQDLDPHSLEPTQPQPGQPIPHPQQEIKNIDQLLKSVWNESQLTNRNTENTIIHLQHIKAFSNKIRLFEQQTHTNFFIALAQSLGLAQQAQEVARFNKVQENILSYLAICEQDVQKLIAEQKFPEAIALLNSLAETVDNPIPYLSKIAELHAMQNDFQTAIHQYTSILGLIPQEQTDSRASCYSSLGTCLYHVGLLDQAHAAFTSAISCAPQTQGLHYSFIEFLLSHPFLAEMGIEPFNTYLNSITDQVCSGNLILDTTYYTTITELLQRKYEETGELEFQGIATRFLQHTGNYYAHEQNFDMTFAISMIAARKIRFSPTHPFFNIDANICERSDQMPYPPIGAFFDSLGGNEIKHGVIKGALKMIDSKPTIVLDFKTTYPTRDKINDRLALLQKNAKHFNPPIEITQETYTYRKRREDGTFSDTCDENLPMKSMELSSNLNVLAISFPNCGKIIIGHNSKWGSLYNRIQIELPAQLPEAEALFRIQHMLSMIGLPNVLTQQSLGADQRIKILQLFRTFFPQQAFTIERNEQCLEMSPENLIAFIIMTEPSMQSVFNTYLTSNLMQKIEILPNCPVWHVMDLSDKLKEQGAWGFMAGVHHLDVSTAGPAIAFLLQYGSFSSQIRFDAGRIRPGLSSISDHLAGGADCVFTRIVTQTLSKELINSASFSGTVQVLFDLSLANRGGYAYTEDQFGVRNQDHINGDEYAERKNFLDSAKQIDDEMALDNEYMFKHAVGSEFIKGLVVQNQDNKIKLVNALKDEGVVEFKGKPIEEWIYVATHFTQELFT